MMERRETRRELLDLGIYPNPVSHNAFKSAARDQNKICLPAFREAHIPIIALILIPIILSAIKSERVILQRFFQIGVGCSASAFSSYLVDTN